MRLALAFFILLTAGSAFGQAAGDYRSLGGDWSSTSSWERYNGSTWVAAPSAPTTTDGVITIIASTTIDVTTAIDADQVLVESDAILNIQSGGYLRIFSATVTDLDITIGDGFFTNDGFCNVKTGGTLEYRGQVSSSITNLQVDGTVIHNQNGGTIPYASWNTNSLLEIQGVINTKPSGFVGQVFYNFKWNCSTQSVSISLLGELTDVLNNFDIVSTAGSSNLLILSTNSSSTVNVGGNLSVINNAGLGITQSGNPFVLNVGGDITINSTKAGSFSGTSTGNVTINAVNFTKSNTGGMTLVSTGSSAVTGTVAINLTGNFVQNAGTLTMAAGTNAGSLATSTIQVGGNFTLNGGTITESASPAASAGNIVFPTGSHTFANSGTISNTINFLVSNSSILDVGTSAITGSGTFTLNPSSSLYVGSTDTNGAIQTGSAAGNIRNTGSRTYDATATIRYNGASAQKIGNGFPTNVNLEIANASGVTNNNVGVTNVVGNLTLTSGAFIIGASNTLNIQSNFIATGGTISGSLTSNLSFTGSGSMSTLTLTPGSQLLNNLTVGRSGTLVLGSNLTVAGIINLSFGDLNITGRTVIMNGSAITTTSNGLISTSATNSNLTFLGSTFSGAVPFKTGSIVDNLTFSVPSGTYLVSNVQVNSNLFITAGTVTHVTGLTLSNLSTIWMNGGSYTGPTPTTTPIGGSFNVTYQAAGTVGSELPISGTTLRNLTIDPSSGVVSLGSNDITIGKDLILTSGTLSAGSNNITFQGAGSNLTVNGGSFSPGTGTMKFPGSTTIGTGVSGGILTLGNIDVSGSLTLPTLASNVQVQIGGNINATGTINPGTGTTTFNGTTTITITNPGVVTFNNVVISGSLTASSGTTKIIGNWSNSGTFNHNNGLINFNGSTTIGGSSTTNFFDVTVSGALTAPSGTLGIAGNFSNTGTFTNNSGIVSFNGTVSSQSITGSATTFNNISVSNATGVNINTTVRLDGILTLVGGGVFDADGAGSGIFIVSSSSQNAGGRIASLTTPSNFSGNVTIERYIHGQSGGDYRYLSMPITNGNVGLWKSSLFVTGNFSDHNTNADNANIFDSGNTTASIYTYNSTTQAYVPVSGGGGTTASTALSSRVGYSAYDFNNGAVTASYRGTIEKGSVPVTISGTASNFNLVPNPYPSPIDWDNVVKTNVNNAIYLRITNNVFTSYVGGIANNIPFGGWSGEIATGQSFFVVSSGAGTTFTFNESDKTSNSSRFLRETTADNYFRIALSSDAGQRDEAVLHFVSGATDGMDGDYDALKMKNGISIIQGLPKKPYLNISTYLDSPGTQFAINSINTLSSSKIVHLSITDVSVGKHTLAFSDLSMMTLGYSIVLVDNYLNKEMEVVENAIYNFEVDGKPDSYGDTRFYLRINGTGVVTGLEQVPSELKVYPNPVSGKLQIELSAEQEKLFTGMIIYDAMGNSMLSSETDKSLLNPGKRIVDLSSFSSGVYILSIHFGEITKSTRVVKQ